MSTRQEEFGFCNNEQYRLRSEKRQGADEEQHEIDVEEEAPLLTLFSVYISFLVVICIGHVRDFFGQRFRKSNHGHLMANKGYAALNNGFESFYDRRLRRRLGDCLMRPTTGVPGRTILCLDRKSADYNDTYEFTGRQIRALNVSSYNYLGFAAGVGGCADAVKESIERYGYYVGASQMEGGRLDLHEQAEALVARFVGHEAALIYSMGWETNAGTLPALVGKGDLIISDGFNHNSLRVGARLAGARVVPFKHNDFDDLERVLRQNISNGQPRHCRPWKKILVLIEGLYSMEGTMPDLQRVMKLKQRYKFYLYIDEAHSIGALGPYGRGICDYSHVNPRSVDILMGTFTKSFGAAGGYVAGSKALIDRLRLRSLAGSYGESVSPAVLTQIIASTASIMGVEGHVRSSSPWETIEDEPMFPHLGPMPEQMLPKWLKLPRQLADGTQGKMRLRRLAFNARYLSRGLRKLGFLVYGAEDSPIVPLLLFNIGKMAEFSRLMLARPLPIAVVVVSFPATTMTTSRVRFCVSASHTKEDIDEVLRACDEIGDVLGLKYHSSPSTWTIDEVTSRALDVVHGK